MAATVSTQVALVVTACVCGVSSHACTEQAPSAAAAATANQKSGAQRVPTALPDAATAAVRALLQRSHNMLQGGDKMANALVMLGRSANDEHREQIVLSEGDRMHVVRRNGQVDVRLTTGAWHVTRGEKPVALDQAATARLDRFQTLIRAALLEPLYRAEKIDRQGPTVFRLIMAGGETWRLEVATFEPPDGGALILPKSLTGPPGQLNWLEYRHNGPTNLPRVMQLGEFGKVWYDLEDSDLLIDPTWFSDPLSPAPKAKRRATQVLDDAPPALRVGVPVLDRTKASRSLVLSDPGSWPGRFDLVWKHGKILDSQGQESADLDFMFEVDGERFYAMPFTMGLAGGRPFVALAGQVIRRLPGQRVVLVRPPKGSLSACEKAAREILARFVKEHELEVAGPLRLRPLVEMSIRPKSMREFEQLWVQCELPVK